MTTALLVGLRADAVNYDKWPQLSPDLLEAAFRDVQQALKAEHIDARWCLTDEGQTAEATLRAALEDFHPDIIMVGAGVRTDPDHLHLFEKILNTAKELAPNAKFAFNIEPLDTVAAVRRWL